MKSATSAKTEHKKLPKWRRVLRRFRWTILTILAVLLVLRMALPYIVKTYVNRQLAKVPEYGGQIGDVDIHLYRGAYQIHDIRIVKTSGSVPVPFFAAKSVDLSVQWRELFHGALVAEIILDHPELNFVAAPTEAETQTGKGRSWDETLKSLFPFRINLFGIRDGQVHFRNFSTTPNVDISIQNLFVTATNLGNSRDLKEKLPAGVMAQARTPDGGEVGLDLKLNPLASQPTFELNATVTNVDLTTMNDFLKAYGKFDVERGKLGLFTSVASSEGTYEGYVKVFFENLDVFAWEKERKKNVLEVFWQAVVGATTTLFKNQPKDQLATKVPLAGSYESKQVGVWTAVGTLLQNAFIRALVPKLDQTVNVEEVEIKTDKKSPP